jgi:hypothetical protein
MLLVVMPVVFNTGYKIDIVGKSLIGVVIDSEGGFSNSTI